MRLRYGVGAVVAEEKAEDISASSCHRGFPFHDSCFAYWLKLVLDQYAIILWFYFLVATSHLSREEITEQKSSFCL